MSLTVVHEHNQHGQHRIVTLADDGTNSAGEWVPTEELARHLNLYANANFGNGLPGGVFKVKEVPCQVLV